MAWVYRADLSDHVFSCPNENLFSTSTKSNVVPSTPQLPPAPALSVFKRGLRNIGCDTAGASRLMMYFIDCRFNTTTFPFALAFVLTTSPQPT